MIDSLARALWEVPPYSRAISWDKAGPELRAHYRARAAELMRQFDISAKGIR